MGLKSRVGWLMHGGDALESIAADLRALQQKVARIDDELQALRAGTGAATNQRDLEAIRLQLRDAVDDLGDRIGSLAERLNSTG